MVPWKYVTGCRTWTAVQVNSVPLATSDSGTSTSYRPRGSCEETRITTWWHTDYYEHSRAFSPPPAPSCPADCGPASRRGRGAGTRPGWSRTAAAGLLWRPALCCPAPATPAASSPAARPHGSGGPWCGLGNRTLLEL